MNYISVLAEDRRLITYRPSLRGVCGSVTATILFQQILYWWDKSGRKPFWKYKAPCESESYKPGDSWCEELGFSPCEFDTALKGISFKTKKKELEKAVQENPSILVFFWTDTSRKTYYFLNEQAVKNACEAIFVNQESQFTKSRNPDLYVNKDSLFTKDRNPDLSYTVDYTEEYTKTTSGNNIADDFSNHRAAGSHDEIDFGFEQQKQDRKQEPIKAKKEKEKNVAPKKEKEGYAAFVKEFDLFHQKLSMMPLDFPTNGKANMTTKGLAESWKKLKGMSQLDCEKSGGDASPEIIEAKAVHAFKYITSNWSKLEGFLAGQFSPMSFANNLPKIVAQIKNGTGKYKNEFQKSFETLRELGEDLPF